MAMTVDACKVSLVGKSARDVITETQSSTPYGGKLLIPRCQEKPLRRTVREPYLKPTQVDEENIQRRSRERSFRNSAN